jgi:GNAT superfamily N-acetyltransferase
MNGPPARRPARNIVQIRHLDVDQAVRKAGIATEMLAAALDHAFDIAPLGQVPTAADKVIILSNSFAPGGEVVQEIWFHSRVCRGEQGLVPTRGCRSIQMEGAVARGD